MPKKKKKRKKKKDRKADERLREILERFRGEATESVRAVWLAGLGALDSVDRQGGRILEDWIARGRDLEGRTRVEIEELLDRGEEWAAELRERVASRGRDVESAVRQAVDRMGIPTQEDLDALHERIAELEAEIARRRAAAKATRKPSPKRAKTKAPRKRKGAGKKASAKPKARSRRSGKTSEPKSKASAETWLVEPAADGWVVRRRGRDAAESRHATKKPAVDEARQRARKAKGALVIHRQDGSVQSEHSYDDA